MPFRDDESAAEARVEASREELDDAKANLAAVRSRKVDTPFRDTRLFDATKTIRALMRERSDGVPKLAHHVVVWPLLLPFLILAVLLDLVTLPFLLASRRRP